MANEEKLHTLTITEHNPETRFFRYQFSCPEYNNEEYAPCAMSTPCTKYDYEPDDDDTETFVKHGQEHFLIDGKRSIELENTCAVRDYPETANDWDIDEIAQEHGNGTYTVDVKPNPDIQPATWDIIFKNQII